MEWNRHLPEKLVPSEVFKKNSPPFTEPEGVTHNVPHPYKTTGKHV
jgi:hypothetical protein